LECSQFIYIRVGITLYDNRSARQPREASRAACGLQPSRQRRQKFVFAVELTVRQVASGLLLLLRPPRGASLLYTVFECLSSQCVSVDGRVDHRACVSPLLSSSTSYRLSSSCYLLRVHYSSARVAATPRAHSHNSQRRRSCCRHRRRRNSIPTAAHVPTGIIIITIVSFRAREETSS